jgi:hypothetical protein
MATRCAATLHACRLEKKAWLTHHVHILEMNGESYRLKASRGRRSRDPEAAVDAG